MEKRDKRVDYKQRHQTDSSAVNGINPLQGEQMSTSLKWVECGGPTHISIKTLFLPVVLCLCKTDTE